MEIGEDVTRNNEGVLPAHSVAVGGRLCQFVEGWKRITNDPYVLSIVANGYRLPGTQGIWRVAPSYRLKTTETPHRRFSLSHAHHKLSAEYRQKGRLSVQNKSAGCVLSCTYTSGQQEVPTFCLRKQGISVSSTSLRSEHCPQGIYLPGTYSVQLTSIVRGFR